MRGDASVEEIGLGSAVTIFRAGNGVSDCITVGPRILVSSPQSKPTARRAFGRRFALLADDYDH